MSDLWDYATRDIEAERTEAGVAHATAALEPFLPFLRASKTETEFSTRLSLQQGRIAEALSAATDVEEAHKVALSNLQRDVLAGIKKRAAVKSASRQARRKQAEVTHSWSCQDCGTIVERHRGQGDVSCLNCGAPYNAGGQRLRDDYAGNPSMYDDEIGDLEGYEMQHSRWASRKQAGGYQVMDRSEFPRVPNPNFPGETTIACPVCGSMSLEITTARSGLPGGDTTDIVICRSCDTRFSASTSSAPRFFASTSSRKHAEIPAYVRELDPDEQYEEGWREGREEVKELPPYADGYADGAEGRSDADAEYWRYHGRKSSGLRMRFASAEEGRHKAKALDRHRRQSGRHTHAAFSGPLAALADRLSDLSPRQTIVGDLAIDLGDASIVVSADRLNFSIWLTDDRTEKELAVVPVAQVAKAEQVVRRELALQGRIDQRAEKELAVGHRRQSSVTHKAANPYTRSNNPYSTSGPSSITINVAPEAAPPRPADDDEDEERQRRAREKINQTQMTQDLTASRNKVERALRARILRDNPDMKIEAARRMARATMEMHPDLIEDKG